MPTANINHSSYRLARIRPCRSCPFRGMNAAQRDIDFAIAEHNLAPEKDTLSLFAIAQTDRSRHFREDKVS